MGAGDAGEPITRVAVVGCGYWGPNVVRNFVSLEGAQVTAVCDLDPARLSALGRLYPAIRTTRDFRSLLDAADVDAIAVCTPVASHRELAGAALEAGKHVLLEKPMAHSVEAAEQLVELADQRQRVLHVDHTFVHSGPVRKIREIIDSGGLGDLLYVDSVRINLGLFQADVNVVWDLAPHDVSIINHLVDERPRWVSATGSVHYGQLESQAYVAIKYPTSLVAHLHVNWLAPVKLRSTLIGGSQRMIVYDDLAPSEKLRVYEKGVTLNSDSQSRQRALVDYRIGDMHAPYIDKTEPLQRACQTFLDSIRAGTPAPTDGRAGLEVVRILEAAQRSLGKDGERIFLDAES